MGRSKQVDEKIAKAPPFARPILEHLRALVHETRPGVEEAIKWGMPHFVWQGKNVAGMAAFKAHCGFIIHGDGRQGDALGQFGKLTSLEGLPPEKELRLNCSPPLSGTTPKARRRSRARRSPNP